MQSIGKSSESNFFDAIIEQAQKEQEKTASIAIAGRIAIKRVNELSVLLQKYANEVTETGSDSEQATESMNEVMQEMLSQMRIIKREYRLQVNP
jgi:hypothetical protein